jgi:hypothetical protein
VSKMDKSKPVSILFRRGELTRFALIKPSSWSADCQEPLCWNRVFENLKIFFMYVNANFF